MLIAWSRMKFKASKSRSLTFRNGKQIQRRFKIGGDHIPTIKEEPVKSLGRLYSGNLTDRHEGVLIQKQAEEGLASIQRSNLPGKFKVWCLQFGLYPRLAWPLLIYDVALSRVEIIEQKCSKFIRKWLGLPVFSTLLRCTEEGDLYSYQWRQSQRSTKLVMSRQ